MNILQEIEMMRQRMLQEINMEFDMLIERVSTMGDKPEIGVKNYELTYPLKAGTGIFKGKKPTAVIINGERIKVKTWKELVVSVLNKCIEDKKNKARLYELVGNISGKKRMLLSDNADDMRSPVEIAKNMYMETHYDTETLLNILVMRILIPIDYDTGNILVVIRNE